MIEDYINRESVIRLLIKQRCKFAAQINQCNVLFSVVKHNQSNHKSTDSEHETIYKLFPQRSKWVVVGRQRDSNGKYKRRKSLNQVELIFYRRTRKQ